MLILTENIKYDFKEHSLIINDDIIHLEDWSQILYSAYGDNPPQEITDQLKERRKD